MCSLFGNEDDWVKETTEFSKLHQNATVFALCYSLDNQWLVASTDTGVVNIFNLNQCMQTFRTQNTTSQRPSFAFPVSEAPIYSLTFAGSNEKPILMVGTDEETFGFDWKGIVEKSFNWKDDGSAEKNIQCLLRLKNPQKTGRRGRTTGVAETNALRCDTTNAANIVHAAAGDSVCYSWNIETEQCVGKCVGHQKYLHDIVLLPQSNSLATASEDGTVKMWDMRTSTCSSTVSPLGRGSVVQSLLIDSGENWLVCGGQGESNSGRVALLCGGVMAGIAEAPAPIHSLCECDGLIVSAGAEGYLRNWSRDLSRVITSVSTTPSISYDAIYNGKNESARILASCGASSTIDLFIPSDDVCTPCGFVLEVVGQYNNVMR